MITLVAIRGTADGHLKFWNAAWLHQDCKVRTSEDVIKPAMALLTCMEVMLGRVLQEVDGSKIEGVPPLVLARKRHLHSSLK